MIRVGIVGVTGYGGGEALRLVATHPQFELVYVAGESSAGSKLIERYPGIGKLGDLVVQKSNTICFSIAAVAGDTGWTGVPGAPAGGTNLTPPTHTPADEGSPEPLQPVGSAAGIPGLDVPRAAPALETSAISLPVLPRTGADPFALVRVGALLILLGGVALAIRTAIPRPCRRS